MMAARFSKQIFALLLCFSTCNSLWAADGPRVVAWDAVKISYGKFKRSKAELEAAIDRCDKNRKPVPSSSFSGLELSQEQLRVVLFVLNSRAEAACEEGAREKLFFAANAHVAVADHYRINAKDAVDYAGDLLFSRQWQRMEYEAAYMKLDARIRKNLEAIDAMQVPFDIFRTLCGLSEKECM